MTSTDATYTRMTKLPTTTLQMIVREYPYLLANPNEISRERRTRLGELGAIREIREDLGVARRVLVERATEAFDEFSR